MDTFMRRALELAKYGEETVSPNPMVGCVIVQGNEIVGEGYHEYYGGPHAEINALKDAGNSANEATVYVTLEPCNHYGKTPPCTQALINAKIAKVVVAMRDPNPLVSGKGIQKLRDAGIEVVEFFLEEEARDLNYKYVTRYEKDRPWIVAKWAMTLDGKIASRTGSSQWISSESSRYLTHRLRGCMDAIMVGSRTILLDDPSLTVRILEMSQRANIPIGENPLKNTNGSGNEELGDEIEYFYPKRRITDETRPKTPLRVVWSSNASISLESRLVKTAREVPVLIAVDPAAPLEKLDQLKKAGCEVLVLPVRLSDVAPEARQKRARDNRPGTLYSRSEGLYTLNRSEVEYRHNLEIFQKRKEQLLFLFETLAKRDILSILVEGGGSLLGSLFDAKMIDEVHVFIAPKLIGGIEAVPPIAGYGIAEMCDALELQQCSYRMVEKDIYVHGRVKR